MFKFRWLRDFFKRNMNYIPEERAVVWKQRISLVYMLVAWNAFGLVCYMIFKGKHDWAKPYRDQEEIKLTPAQYWSRNLGIRDAKVFKISGTSVSQYEVHNEDIQKK